MKYKYLLLLLFVSASLKAACQEKFIEVTVSDTAWVTPNQFIYSITANPNTEDFIPDTSNDNSAGGLEKRKTLIC